LHDEQTAGALLRVAEQIAESEGWEALSARRIADAAGTTTRAVYSGFGSMPGVIAALGSRGFDLLREYIEQLPVTDDLVADVVAAGAVAFRNWAAEHRALFEVSIQRRDLPPAVSEQTRAAASRAWGPLHERLQRLPRKHLRGRSVALAGVEFHVACEGLASLDLRTKVSESMPGIWEDTLRSLVVGWAHNPPS